MEVQFYRKGLLFLEGYICGMGFLLILRGEEGQLYIVDIGLVAFFVFLLKVCIFYKFLAAGYADTSYVNSDSC